MKYIIFIGSDFSHLVGDIRIIASEIMSLKLVGYNVFHLIPSNSDQYTSLKEQVILKSNSYKTIHIHLRVPQKYIYHIIKKLNKEYNIDIMIVAIRNISLMRELINASRNNVLVFLIDNLRYINPKKIYESTGNINEALKTLPGMLYYNTLYSASLFNIAFSKSLKNSFLLKNKIMMLPPCYVEIYHHKHKDMINDKIIKHKIEQIKDYKAQGLNIVLHAKVFGPKNGIPPKVWYRTLGFYSYISLYVMAKYLKNYVFITWDATPRLFEFYIKSLNIPELPNNIIYLPWVPQKYINELYKLIDIVTIPRLGWHEYGVTTSLIEALYFGKPVLTTSNVLKNLGLDALQHEGLIAEDNIYVWPKMLKKILEKSDPRHLGLINRGIYDRLFSLSVRAKKLKRLLDALLKT
jgi:hypothetical protein